MSVLIAFIIMWVVAPGPIAVLTLNRSRSQGVAAGVAVATGAAITTGLIFAAVLSVNLLNIPIVQFSTSRVPQIFGAVLIISLGLHAGYKATISSDCCNGQTNADATGLCSQRRNIAQGMLIATSGIPQSIIFYLILIPQTVAADDIQWMLLAFGVIKIAFTFVWYSGVASLVSVADHWLSSPQNGRRFDFATSLMMVGFGINILV